MILQDKTQVVADLKALASLLVDGWCQTLYYDRRAKCHCLIGGMVRVASDGAASSPSEIYPASGTTASWERFKDLSAVIQDQLARYHGCTDTGSAEWNDWPGQIKESVVGVVQDAAHRLEEFSVP